MFAFETQISVIETILKLYVYDVQKLQNRKVSLNLESSNPDFAPFSSKVTSAHRLNIRAKKLVLDPVHSFCCAETFRFYIKFKHNDNLV